MRRLIGSISATIGTILAEVLHVINHVTMWGIEDEMPCPNCIERDYDAYL